ncbi:hypothetical protein B0H14DRAFT_2561936 [Mycena olivaceomarginata]|nr:hypothetical protein B0H14DRAFT_2561936 [Mycena olivaceomarginata]
MAGSFGFSAGPDATDSGAVTDVRKKKDVCHTPYTGALVVVGQAVITVLNLSEWSDTNWENKCTKSSELFCPMGDAGPTPTLKVALIIEILLFALHEVLPAPDYKFDIGIGTDAWWSLGNGRWKKAGARAGVCGSSLRFGGTGIRRHWRELLGNGACVQLESGCSSARGGCVCFDLALARLDGAGAVAADDDSPVGAAKWKSWRLPRSSPRALEETAGRASTGPGKTNGCAEGARTDEESI